MITPSHSFSASCQRKLASSFVIVIFCITFSVSTYAEPLPYQGSNNWVAQADAKPLRALLAHARQGKTHFLVTLPADNRPRATARLEILRDLLEREAKTGITLEETATGTATPNTLEITLP